MRVLRWRPGNNIFCTQPDHGFARRLLQFQCVSEAAASLGKIRFQSYGFLELADRLVRLAVLKKSITKIVMGFGEFRFQADHFLKLADCIFGSIFLKRGNTEIVARLDEIRFQSDGPEIG